MRDLPPCRHRGSQVANNRWVCHSPGVEVLGGIASGEMCLDLCPHIDHPVSLGKLDRDMDRPGVMEGSNPNSARLELEAPVKVIVQPSQLSIAMVTAPRPISTVERSLTELRHGGFTQRVHLFSEPGSSLLCQSDVVTHQHSKRLGAWKNWITTAQTMLDECDSPFILLCEDDIRLARCAANGLQFAIDHLPHGDWGFVSLYSPIHNVKEQLKQSGWIQVTRRSIWGALAWCFSRESLEMLVSSDLVTQFDGDRDTDLVVPEAIRRSGRRIYSHLPSLAAHTGGGISSLGHMPLGDSDAVGFDSHYQRYVATCSLSFAMSGHSKATPSATITSPRDHSIAVVVANYNCGPHLKTCLDSLHRQTVGCEIVVVDDASTDDSLYQLATHHPSTRVIRHPHNLGANPSRLTGLRNSESTWVVMADADAVYAPRYLESMLASANDETSVVYCSMRRSDVETGKEKVLGCRPFDASDLWWKNYVSMCSLVRRSALPLDLMATSDFLEDWRLWLHLASCGHRFEFVNEVLFDAFLRRDGKSRHIEINAHRLSVEIADLRRPYAKLIGCDQPITVVIPATNCADLTSESLWHLARYTGLPLHVVYVDNGSRPGVVEEVQQVATALRLPLEVIRNRVNRGFTRAVNQGIERAGGSHVLCLNNDCFVGPQCVDRMFSAFQTPGDRVAAVGPLTGDNSRHSLRQDWLRDEAKVARDNRFDYNDPVAGFQAVRGARRSRRDPLIAFFCTLLHRDALAQCGWLDERTPEFRSGLGADDEWCHRVVRSGWQLRMEMSAYAAHLGKRTFEHLGMDRENLQQESLQRLAAMDYHPPTPQR